MQNTLIIGDIHGCLNELKEMISMVPEGTKIISCGDLIDRGPDSRGVVQYCIDNDIQVYLGNHEHTMINLFKSDDWMDRDYSTMLKQYDSREEMSVHIEYFKTLPIYINTGHTIRDLPVIASHTYILDMVDPDVDDGLASISDAMKIPLVWSRTRPGNEKSQQWVNIHGHTPTENYKLIKTPMYTKSSINIDTGCCYDSWASGYLTGILLPSENVIQVKRKG